MGYGTTRALRWALVVVGFVLCGVLLWRGAILIGVLVGVLLLLRIGMLFSTSSRAPRRGQWGGQRMGGRRGGGGMHGQGRGGMPLPGLGRREVQVAASVIGTSPETLRQTLQGGGSIAQAAAAAGVAPQTVVDAMVTDATLMVERAVAEGTVAPQRAEQVKANLPQWANHLFNRTGGGRGAGRGARRPLQ